MKSKNLDFRRVADAKGRLTIPPSEPELFSYENWKGQPEDDTTYFFIDEQDLVIYYYSDKGGFEFVSRHKI